MSSTFLLFALNGLSNGQILPKTIFEKVGEIGGKLSSNNFSVAGNLETTKRVVNGIGREIGGACAGNFIGQNGHTFVGSLVHAETKELVLSSGLPTGVASVKQNFICEHSQGKFIGEETLICANGYEFSNNSCICKDCPSGTGPLTSSEMIMDIDSSSIINSVEDWIALDCSEVLSDVKYIDKATNPNEFSGNEATTYCSGRGMRLPTREEALCIYNNKNIIKKQTGSSFLGFWHRTKTNCGNTANTISKKGVLKNKYTSSCVLVNYSNNYALSFSSGASVNAVFTDIGLSGADNTIKKRYVICIK